MNLRIAPHIGEALARGEPVVALESTVITHGLPHPQNLELAADLEEAVRRGGAVPATIAVIGGEPVVGAGRAELERLAAVGPDKASLWNLGSLLATGADAGTTVAATLHIAALAGIKTFATGGIGGVHPQPFDESADLVALSRYPVVTVSSGPKSILLAGATLERLESLGVPVIGHRSSKLAGFHVQETDLPLPARAQDPAGIAAAFRAHVELGLPGGMLVSNPVSEGLDGQRFACLRDEAQRQATEAGVTGKEVTPFLLSALARLSDSDTVTVNLRLLKENALLAARVAAALAANPEKTASEGVEA